MYKCLHCDETFETPSRMLIETGERDVSGTPISVVTEKWCPFCDSEDIVKLPYTYDEYLSEYYFEGENE